MQEEHYEPYASKPQDYIVTYNHRPMDPATEGEYFYVTKKEMSDARIKLSANLYPNIKYTNMNQSRGGVLPPAYYLRNTEYFRVGKNKGPRLDLRKPVIVVRKEKSEGKGYKINPNQTFNKKEDHALYTEFLAILPISRLFWEYFVRLLTILFYLNNLVNCDFIMDQILDLVGPKSINFEPHHLLQVFTHDSAMELYCYEILEFFGDTVLHLYTTLEVFPSHISEDSFKNLSGKRSFLDSNKFLASKLEKNLNINHHHVMNIDFLSFNSTEKLTANSDSITNREKILGDLVESLTALFCRPDQLVSNRISSTALD